MKTADVIAHLTEIADELMFADGFEDALIGYVDVRVDGGPELVALYDRLKCVEILKKRDGMSHENAVEFFEFNVAGAYVGRKTPAFATILRRVK